MTSKLELAAEATKSAPAVAASTLILFGYPLTEWVVLGSLVLIALQIFFLIRDKIYRPMKGQYERKRR